MWYRLWRWTASFAPVTVNSIEVRGPGRDHRGTRCEAVRLGIFSGKDERASLCEWRGLNSPHMACW